MLVMDDGLDTSCVGRVPTNGSSAPSDDEERATAESRRDADEHRDAARADRWARCLVNMVQIFERLVCGDEGSAPKSLTLLMEASLQHRPDADR